MRNMMMVMLVSLLGVFALWAGTDGFHAYTSEGALRYAITNHPVRLPDVTLQDQNGDRFSMASLDGKLVLFTFFYARCSDVCPVLETQFGKVVDGIPESYKGTDIVFLSVSFDPENDDPDTLKHFADYFQADGAAWRIATVPNREQLQALLNICNVVVIPNKQGGYEHNAAIYAMDRERKLTHIFDYNTPDTVVRNVMALLEA